MNQLWQDVRYGFRMLAGKPGFTAAAVLVLAVGIGANSAVFSLINAFLLKPVHVEKPEELAGLFSRDAKHPDSYRAFSYPAFVDLRQNHEVFASAAALNMGIVGVQEGNTTRRAFVMTVSSNYFETLGVKLLKGRTFLADEEKPGAELTAIATYTYWMKNGADPDLLGKRVRINGRQFTIVGITPKGFTGTTAMVSPELLVPFSAYAIVMNDFEGHVKPLAAPDNHSLIVVVRLTPGTTLESAGAKLAVLSSQMEQAYPAENKDQTLVVRRLARMSISTSPQDEKSLRAPAILLLSLAAVVLLIASLNLANMMLAKGTARRKELAIRLAIGGSRSKIVRQLVTEGMLLAMLGGAGGLLLASWSTTLLMQSLATLAPIEIIYDASPDARVLAFTLLFCMLSTVVFALMPAWKLSRPDVWVDLKENTSEDSSGRRRLFSRGNVLVMAQISLSLMMLTAAGLFVHSAMHAANVQPGFAIENQVLAEVDASLIDYDQAHASPLYRTVKDRLRQIPGVESVAIAATVPFGMIQLGKNIAPSDAPVSKDLPPLGAQYNIVSEDYFQTLGIPVLRGRTFRSAESMEGAKNSVAIIDRMAAEKLWPHSDALGKHIVVIDGPARQDLEVVGVVGNIRENIVGAHLQPHLYLPFGPEYQADVQFHLKVAGGAETRVLESVRREIAGVDEKLPLLGLKTMRTHFESGFDIWIVRTGAHILEIFGTVALLLAVIGLYALNAYTVARRTREIGIRMALGADASSTMRMILGEALKVTLIAMAAALLLSAGLGKLLSGFLYEIQSFDPLVLLASPLALGLVAVAACYLPARRAARVDPIIALRYE